eukprot:359937-Chlamydomonas_euryale.AAC.20
MSSPMLLAASNGLLGALSSQTMVAARGIATSAAASASRFAHVPEAPRDPILVRTLRRVHDTLRP